METIYTRKLDDGRTLTMQRDDDGYIVVKKM